jgi:hypothetical protein
MAIKNEQFLKELQPYSKMTVVPGVTVGDLNFASAQSAYSTTYIAPQANDQFAANREADLFQAAIGDNGQGLASGQVMSRAQTNWLDTAGRLPANEVFLGIRCLVSVYKHTNAPFATLANGASFANVTTTFSKQMPITNVAAVFAIINGFSWEYQVGDGIIRNVGALAGYPQGGGVWSSPVAAFTTAEAAQNGYPCPTVAKELPIPFMFLPNINTRVKVKSGSQINVPAGTFNLGAGGAEPVVADFLAIRMTFQGYKLTMPV